MAEASHPAGGVAAEVLLRQEAEELLAAARRSGDMRREASALVDLADLDRRAGALPRAIDQLQTALKITETLADAALRSDAETSLALTLLAGGQVEPARRLLEKELAGARERRDLFHEKK